MHSAEIRQRFIEASLERLGEISRKDLQQAFGISDTHATNDLNTYKERCSKVGHLENLEYDTSLKKYLVKKEFKRIYPRVEDTEASKYQIHLPIEVVEPFPHQNPKILDILTRACWRSLGIQILYEGTEKPPSQRTIFPHHLVKISHRMHIRAFCPTSHKFKDFVVGRIISAELLTKEHTPEEALEEKDIEWNKFTELHLELSKDLRNPNAISREFNFEGNTLTIQTRQCYIWYLENELGLKKTKRIWEAVEE